MAAVAIVLAIVLFGAANIVMSRSLWKARVDLTQDRIFTVSSATRAVVSRIPEPITMTLYSSQALLDAVPKLRTYAARVDELLRTYEALSKGNLRVQKFDPLPFTDQEDKAIGLQMHGFLINSTGEQGYFGLVATNSTDGLERMEFLDPAREGDLEYDLTSMVDRLSHADKRKIAIVDGLNMFGSRDAGRRPWTMLDIINKNYHVADALEPKFDLASYDALLITHPHNLSPPLLFAIDQFVLAGKPALIFVDPLAENSQPSQKSPEIPEIPSSDLGNLLSSWGLDIPKDKIVGDKTMALRVTAVAGRQRIVASYLPWLQVSREYLNPDDAATQQLSLMRLSSAGAIQLREGSRLQIKPLISSSTDSMLLDRADVIGRPDPNVLLNKFKTSGQRFVMAARIQGVALSAFASGAPAGEDGKPVSTKVLSQSSGPLKLVVVADADLLSDSHVIDQRGDSNSSNADFVLNALDDLMGSTDLSGLRGRGISVRPFTAVDKMEADAEDKYRSTERELSAQLEEAQKQLTQMQSSGGPGAGDLPFLSRDQQSAIAKYNVQIVDLRRKLRDVRAAQKSRIETLELQLKLFNILLSPLLLFMIGGGVWLYRRTRTTRRQPTFRAGAAA